MTEAYLAMVCLLYGILLLAAPATAFQSDGLEGLAWAGYGRWLATPFLVKGAAAATGLILNINGSTWSRYFRFGGAFIGSFIWYWFVYHYLTTGTIGTIGFVFTLVAGYLSMRIMAMALADLPPSGAPAALR